MSINDVVLLTDPNASRNDWPMGIVENVFPGDDGLVRRAKIRIVRQGSSKTVGRSIQSLIVLVEAY